MHTRHMPMRVSVVIPLYNKAATVLRALDSVAAQTFGDFEALVIDDGSTDGGDGLVQAYRDPRFRMIRQANAGPGAARNRGIAEARGEFLAFLDADDEWLPEYLKESLRLFETSPPDVATVTSGFVECPSGRTGEALYRRRGVRDGVHRLTPETPAMLAVHMLAYMSPWSTVCRAPVVRKWGGFYARDGCRYAEDAFLWLKVLLNERVAFTLRPFVIFHREASSLSSNLTGPRPVEPFIRYPEEIRAVCPMHLRPLLDRILAIRAFKTACVLGYWGQWSEARAVVARFSLAGSWRLPYYVPALVCSTPVGSALGRAWRSVCSHSPG